MKGADFMSKLEKTQYDSIISNSSELGYKKNQIKNTGHIEIDEKKESTFFSVINTVLVYSIAIGAVAFHGISVFLNNITGGHEYFQPGRIFNQAISSFDMKQEQKNLQEKEKFRKEKQIKETDAHKKTSKKEIPLSSTKNERIEKENPQEAISNLKKKITYQPPFSPSDLIPANTLSTGDSELKKMEEKIEHTIQGIAKSKENMDLVINELFAQPSIKNIFKELKITPECDMELGQIYLFSNVKEMNMDKIPVIQKEDLFYGNASSLASAIYSSQDSSNISSAECSAKALLAAVKIKTEIFARDYNEMRQKLSIDKPERYVVANVLCETEKNYGAMYAALSYEKDCIDLYYKDRFLTTVNISTPIEQSIYEINQRIEEIEKEKDTVIYQLNEKISFGKIGDSTLSLMINGEVENFPLTEENDLKAVADYIRIKCPEKNEVADIDAMLMGIAVCPYINKSVDVSEIEINPFTGQQKYTSDIVISHKNGLHYISEQKLQESSLGKGYTQEPIVCIEPYGAPIDFEKLEQIIIEYRKKHPSEERNEEFFIKNSIPSFIDITRIPRAIESPETKNGTLAWEKLEEKSLLDGIDISYISFEKYEKEPFEFKNYFEHVEDEHIMEL